MLRHLLLSGITIVLRLGSTLLVYLALARAWGADAFGTFMLAVTVATVVVRPADYGFLTLVTRELGRTPTAARTILGPMLAGKLLLSGAALGLALVTLLLAPYGLAPLLLGLLIADALLLSWVAFAGAALRGLSRFGAETRALAWMYGATVASALAVLASGGGPVAGAVALVASRAVGVLTTHGALAQAVPGAWRPEWTGSRLRATLRQAGPFALHSAAGLLATTTDTLVVGAVLGPAAVGLYQTGLKLVGAALAVPEALNNVYLTRVAGVSRAARVPDAPHPMAALVRAHARQLAAYGCLVALAMTVTAPAIPWALGTSYAPLVPILPWFGLLLVARTLTHPASTLLVVVGRQGARALGVLAAAIVGAGLQWAAAGWWGLPGALLGAILAGVGLAACYAVIGYRAIRLIPADRQTVALLALTMALVGWALWTPHPLVLGAGGGMALLAAVHAGFSASERAALARLRLGLAARLAGAGRPRPTPPRARPSASSRPCA